MHDYNQYVTAINKIYDYVAKLKAGWDNQDNLSYIEKIEGFQNMVTGSANEFKKPPTHPIEDDEEEDDSSNVQAEKKPITNAFAPNPEPEEKEEIVPPQVIEKPVEKKPEIEETPAKEEEVQPPQEETPAPPQAENPSSPIPQVVASEPAKEEKETPPPQQPQEASSPIPQVVAAEAPPMPEPPTEDSMGLAAETGATTVVAS